MRSLRTRLIPAVVGLAAVAAWAPAAEAQDPVIAAAGDIACPPDDPNYNGGAGTDEACRQRATSDLLVGAGLSAVLPLGDLIQGNSTPANFNASYAPSWGRVKSISRPVLGNHEGSATGYFDYFNGPGVADGPAGPRGKGWYSFDVGAWHLVALNSNCSRPADTTHVVDCGVGSEQERWLRADLAAHPSSCTLAYWHHPRYSSGHDGDNTFMQPMWEALDDAGAELVLSGHSHNYERVAPQNRNGQLDQANGIRQFVVGTGGSFFTGGLGTRIPNSETAQNNTFGVLFLALHPTGYTWQFVPEAGGPFTDSGTASCHNPPAPPPAPAPDVTAPVISELRVSPRRFSVGSRRRAAARGGATFRYELSEASSVRVAVSRRSAGRMVRGNCRSRTRANRRRPRCILYRKAGGFAVQGLTGSNERWFAGRLGGRYLDPGRFRAVFTATDAAGNRSRRRSVSFTLVRRRAAAP